MAAADTSDLPPLPAASARHGSVGLLGAIALVAGSMVGSGIYLLPASLGAIGSISILGWVAATVIALLTAINCWGVKAGSNLQSLLMVLKILAITALTGVLARERR